MDRLGRIVVGAGLPAFRHLSRGINKRKEVDKSPPRLICYSPTATALYRLLRPFYCRFTF